MIFYLIGLLSVIHNIFGVFFVFSVLAAVFALTAYGIATVEMHNSYPDGSSYHEYKTWRERFKTLAAKLVFLAAVSMFITVIVPNRDTMYLMLGSDVLNQVIQSPEGEAVREFIRGLNE